MARTKPNISEKENKEKRAISNRIYFASERGRERVRAAQQKYSKTVKRKESDRVYRKMYSLTERGIEIINRINRHQVESISDPYIRGIIKSFIKVDSTLVPQELIELKRLQLKLNRVCRHIKNLQQP